MVTPLLDVDGAFGSEAWLVTALAHDRRRADASATEALSRSIAYAERENSVQTFLRRIDRLPSLLDRHLQIVGTPTVPSSSGSW